MGAGPVGCRVPAAVGGLRFGVSGFQGFWLVLGVQVCSVLGVSGFRGLGLRIYGFRGWGRVLGFRAWGLVFNGFLGF